MNRIALPLTVALCSFTLVIGAYADKTATTTVTSTSADSPAKEANDAPVGRQHHHHEWIPEKKTVLSLPSLDEGQKSKIEAIYEKNREAFNAIQKQKRELQASEWESIKPILKPDQITSLSTKRRKAPPGEAKPPTAPLDKGEAK